MSNFWTSLKKQKKFLLFLNVIFIVGLIAGFIYFHKVNDTIVVNLQENLLNIEFSSNIIYHVIFLAIIFFFSLLIIGPVIGLFLYFYEALSIGFISAAYFSISGFTGFLYSIIYVIIFKGFYAFFLSLILIKSFNAVRNIVGYFVLKRNCDLKNLAITNFVVIIKYSFIVLIYDVFLSFFGNIILSIFDFLI